MKIYIKLLLTARKLAFPVVELRVTEGWSPRTLVRYGFCREDEAGNILCIWNFSELDAALKGIESDDDAEDCPSEVAGGGVVHGDVELSSLDVLSHYSIHGSDCQHGHKRHLACTGIQHNEAGHIELCSEPCPLCEFEYRRSVEQFYSDRPQLEGVEEWSALYQEMPALERPEAEELECLRQWKSTVGCGHISPSSSYSCSRFVCPAASTATNLPSI